MEHTPLGRGKRRLISPLVFMYIGGFSVLGALVLYAALAAGNGIPMEPENGKLAGAKVQTDATASGGKDIQFASPAPTPLPTTDASWNSHVPCQATVTTLAKILGTQAGSLGGATFAGGGFNPGVPNKNAVPPPCTVNGVGVFVELRKVMFDHGGVNSTGDGDWTGLLMDPSGAASTPVLFTGMHSEVSQNWGPTGNKWVTTYPPTKTLIDIQGFVFWDPAHTDASFHNYTGWEMHPITAWRLAQQ